MIYFTRNIKNTFKLIKQSHLKVDYQFLLFLLLFLNVKLIIKVLAIFFIYFIHPNAKFGFKLRTSRLPLFYISVICIGLFNWHIYGYYRILNYDFALLMGIFLWTLCILATHQVKLFVERSSSTILHNTLIAFFAINVFISFIDIFKIIIEIHTINPYRFQGLFQKYFIGTGDYVKGVFFDTSNTNATINAFGLIYFLNKKEVLMTLLCMATLLLTGSNTTNILLGIVLITLFIFKSDRNQKSTISLCIFFLILFLTKVSPQNNSYSLGFFKDRFNRGKNTSNNNSITVSTFKPDSIYNVEEKKHKIAEIYLDSENNVGQHKIIIADNLVPKTEINLYIRPSIPQPSIHDREHQSSSDTTLIQKELIVFAKKNEDSSILSFKENWQNHPGKLIAIKQTLQFLIQNPLKLFTGNGIANFSSKLALRATGLKIEGGYPQRFAYINNDYKENHLALLLYYFTKRSGYHSITNTPDSVYDQLLSEYGIAGLLCFALFYLGYFMRHLKKLTYGLPILFIMVIMFGLGYWFEQLSVVVLFELLMLINIKEYSSLKIKKN